MDTGPSRREDETEQIESSHRDAICLLEPDLGELAREGRIRISGDIITLERVI